MMLNRNMGHSGRRGMEKKRRKAYPSFHIHINMTMELGHFVWNKEADSYSVVCANTPNLTL